MKRSGQVGLMLMGAAAFTATFASVYAFQRPSTAQSVAAQSCTTNPDGTQSCQQRRGFAYYFLPNFIYGGSSASAAASPQSAAFAGNAPKAQPAALTSTPRTSTPTVSASGTTRNGFGTTAQSSFRVSAGG